LCPQIENRKMWLWGRSANLTNFANLRFADHPSLPLYVLYSTVTMLHNSNLPDLCIIDRLYEDREGLISIPVLQDKMYFKKKLA
jgi:hypothetical protein